MWWKKYKWKILTPVVIVAILAAAFWYGGGSPGLHGWSADPGAAADRDRSPIGGQAGPDGGDSADRPSTPPGSDSADTPDTPADPATPTGSDSTGNPANPATPDGADSLADIPRPGENGPLSAAEKEALAAQLTGQAPAEDSADKDQYLTGPVPDGKPLPVEPENAEITDTAYTCTLSISCAAILDRMDWLDPEKTELVPADGWILEPMEVTFYEGESVFNVLQRTCKQQKLHMEFTNTPLYNSAYIEGIHNLYEFDCGELSGWMYSVNDWFPNYGCSRYALQDGDTVCWQYTCDLGADIGGHNALGG